MSDYNIAKLLAYENGYGMNKFVQAKDGYLYKPNLVSNNLDRFSDFRAEEVVKYVVNSKTELINCADPDGLV